MESAIDNTHVPIVAHTYASFFLSLFCKKLERQPLLHFFQTQVRMNKKLVLI